MNNKNKIFAVIEYVNGEPENLMGVFSSRKKAFDYSFKDAEGFVDAHNKGCDEHDRLLIDLIDEDGKTNLAFRIGYEDEYFRDPKPYDEVYEYEIRELEIDEGTDSSTLFGLLRAPLCNTVVNQFSESAREDIKNFYKK